MIIKKKDNHCCDDHGHADVSIMVILIGGILVLNSYIAPLIYQGQITGEISAIAGAILLSVPIIYAAIKDIIVGKVFMNELVALALLAAFVAEDYQTAGAVAFFMLIAVLIEHRTAVGAKNSIEQLIRMTPKKVHLWQGDVEVDVDVSSLKLNDVLVVRPGETFAVDGTITNGLTSINEASITGESLPVDKKTNDTVFAGTFNLTGLVKIKVTKLGSDTTLGQVRNLIAQAEKSRFPIMKMVDKYASYYVPVILMIASLVAFFSDFNLALVVAILVVACPCALVVSTPSAIIAAIASAARLGLLIKSVTQLELINKVTCFVFDKTGTLTKGDLVVDNMYPAENVSLQELLQSASICEMQSNHPVAKAIIKFAKDAEIELISEQEIEEVSGQGIKAKYQDSLYLAGRKNFLEDNKVSILSPLQELNEAQACVYIAKDGKFLGYITLSDEVRKETKEALLNLKEQGIKDIYVLSGDHKKSVERIISELAVDDFRASCLPQDKLNFIKELQSQGKKVAVVGDGINDAPALASGNISIAMGSAGSEVAISSASIALMNNDLRRIAFLISLSKKMANVMKQNLSIGLISIIGGLFLAASNNLSGVNAAILHTISTLIIILNSARLVRHGEEYE